MTQTTGNDMQLPAPARECSDAELQQVYDHYANIAHFEMRRQPQPLPPLDYGLHTSECAPDDDEPGPVRDLRSMGGFVTALCLAVAIVAVIALVSVLR